MATRNYYRLIKNGINSRQDLRETNQNNDVDSSLDQEVQSLDVGVPCSDGCTHE